MASPAAVLPPPTTMAVLSRKKLPSQVAQYETPRPCSSSSNSRPSLRGRAPVAINDTFRPVFAERGPEHLGIHGEIDGEHLLADMTASEAIGLLLHRERQFEAVRAVGKAGIVLHVLGLSKLPAGDMRSNSTTSSPAPRSVEPCSHTRRPCADDSKIDDGVLSVCRSLLVCSIHGASSCESPMFRRSIGRMEPCVGRRCYSAQNLREKVTGKAAKGRRADTELNPRA